jgi:hypothetical protein
MRNGFLELTNQSRKGNNMAEQLKAEPQQVTKEGQAAQEEARNRVCPPQVLDLVDHLRSTGTGQAKLDRMTELGKTTKNLDEFLSMLPANIPLITMGKVDEYLGKIIVEKEEKVTGKKLKEGWLNTERGKALQKKHREAAKKAEGTGETKTETRSEYQSSLPEYNVLQESKAPVLKPEGSNQTKQLGADVEVPSKSVPESPEEGTTRGEGSEDDAAQSDVADMNADEAKDSISRMRSKEKLQNICETDKRKSVKEAAEARIKEIDGEE